MLRKAQIKAELSAIEERTKSDTNTHIHAFMHLVALPFGGKIV
jgi:hypothetical protein